MNRSIIIAALLAGGTITGFHFGYQEGEKAGYSAAAAYFETLSDELIRSLHDGNFKEI